MGWLGAWGAVRWRSSPALPSPGSLRVTSWHSGGGRSARHSSRFVGCGSFRPYKEICVSGACGSAFLRPPAVLGLRPVPCCWLVRGLRSALGLSARRVTSWRGWSGFVCACLVVAGGFLCALVLWLARARPVAARSLGLYGGRARSLGLYGWGVRSLSVRCLRPEKCRIYV